MKTRLAARDLALTLAVVTVLGFSFVPIKVGLREMPPFALAALRFFFAAVPLVFFIKRPRMPWRSIAGYGFAIGVCQFGVLFLGIKLGMPAGLASVVIQVQVFFTIGLAIAFLGDRLQRQNLIGAAIAAAGIVLLGAYKLSSGANSTFVGFLLVIVAAFAWAVGNIIAKRAAAEHDTDMFALVVWSSLVPPLPLAALSYLFEGGRCGVPRGRLGRCAHLGLRPVSCLGRDAVRLRVVGGAAASLSDRADLAVRTADPRIGPCQRRDLPRRIARADADGGRRTGAGRTGRERLRATVARGPAQSLLANP